VISSSRFPGVVDLVLFQIQLERELTGAGTAGVETAGAGTDWSGNCWSGNDWSGN